MPGVRQPVVAEGGRDVAVPELRSHRAARRTGTDRFARLCYALGVARLRGRVDAGVIERLFKLVASGGLDDLDVGGEEVAVSKKLAEWHAERDGKWPPPAEELRRLYLEQNLTHQQIADMYGVRREVVGVKLQRLGIVKGVRKRSRQPATDNAVADMLAVLIAHGAKVRVRAVIDFECGGKAREASEPQTQGGGEGAV